MGEVFKFVLPLGGQWLDFCIVSLAPYRLECRRHFCFCFLDSLYSFLYLLQLPFYFWLWLSQFIIPFFIFFQSSSFLKLRVEQFLSAVLLSLVIILPRSTLFLRLQCGPPLLLCCRSQLLFSSCSNRSVQASPPFTLTPVLVRLFRLWNYS